MSKNSKQEQQTLESVGFWWPIHKSSLFFYVLLMCVFLMICAIICSQISEALWFLLKGCSTFVTANIQCLRLGCCYWRTSMLRPKRRPVCSWWPRFYHLNSTPFGFKPKIWHGQSWPSKKLLRKIWEMIDGSLLTDRHANRWDRFQVDTLIPWFPWAFWFIRYAFFCLAQAQVVDNCWLGCLDDFSACVVFGTREF